MSTTVGIVVFDDAEELDWVGPWEVFKMARIGHDELRVVLIAQSVEPVRCVGGLRVLPDCSLADAPALDVLLVLDGASLSPLSLRRQDGVAEVNRDVLTCQMAG